MALMANFFEKKKGWNWYEKESESQIRIYTFLDAPHSTTAARPFFFSTSHTWRYRSRWPFLPPDHYVNMHDLLSLLSATAAFQISHQSSTFGFCCKSGHAWVEATEVEATEIMKSHRKAHVRCCGQFRESLKAHHQSTWRPFERQRLKSTRRREFILLPLL